MNAKERLREIEVELADIEAKIHSGKLSVKEEEELEARYEELNEERDDLLGQ